MLGQRRRRWANICQTLARCVVFAGMPLSQELWKDLALQHVLERTPANARD